MKRWSAVIYYRTDAGVIDVQHEIEELEEVAEIVERGPNWYSIDRIVIRHGEQQAGTIEQLILEDHR